MCDVTERDGCEAVDREGERCGAEVDNALLEPKGVDQLSPYITQRALHRPRRAAMAHLPMDTAGHMKACDVSSSVGNSNAAATSKHQACAGAKAI